MLFLFPGGGGFGRRVLLARRITTGRNSVRARASKSRAWILVSTIRKA